MTASISSSHKLATSLNSSFISARERSRTGGRSHGPEFIGTSRWTRRLSTPGCGHGLMDACGRVVLLVGRSRFTSHFALVAHQTRTRTCRRGHVLHVCRYNVGGFAMCMKTGRWLSLDGMARLYCTVLWRWSCNAYVTLRGARRGHASYPDASIYFPQGLTPFTVHGAFVPGRYAWQTHGGRG